MNRFKDVLIVLLALAFAFGEIKSCRQADENEKLLSQLRTITTTLQDFKVQRRADSSSLAKQGQKIVEQKEAIEQGLIKLEKEMKRAVAQVGFKYDIIIDSVDVPFIPDGFADTTSLLANYEKLKASIPVIPVPKDFAVQQKWFQLSGEVRKEGLHFDSIAIPNKSTVTIGYERKNIFSQLKPVVTVENDNPYLKVQSMNNVVIKKKKGIWDSKLFWFAVGSVATIFGISQTQ